MPTKGDVCVINECKVEVKKQDTMLINRNSICRRAV